MFGYTLITPVPPYPSWETTNWIKTKEAFSKRWGTAYPQTNRVGTTFGSLAGANKWFGGVLAENGMIYGVPYTSSTVLKIDPTTNTASTFGSIVETAKYQGGVLAENGMIYCIPRDMTIVLKIDPTTDTISTFGSLPIQDIKWYDLWYAL